MSIGKTGQRKTPELLQILTTNARNKKTHLTKYLNTNPKTNFRIKPPNNVHDTFEPTYITATSFCYKYYLNTQHILSQKLT